MQSVTRLHISSILSGEPSNFGFHQTDHLGFRMMIWSKNVSEFGSERKGLGGPSADAEWSSPTDLRTHLGAIFLKYPGIVEAHAHLA
ncbi:hypothetical protein D6D13_02838 [Aureobasidium pullulans]|uniref:Uncharacterized protein n=1 Tax=Aureobasidium pullulans TaxID=5580 RepID=A0A4S9D3W2_AURPU|nr:hypothetical protein D6D13_02838 [Aureobasidium pullulans]